MKLLFFVLCLLSFKIYAQDGDSTAVETVDTDAIITNIKMRAESGSKSKYSLAFSLGYNTGGLEKPFDEKRPNLSGAAGATEFTSLNGSFSGKYTFDAQRSFFAGFGARWITPTEAKAPPGFDKVDADNPYVRYQYLYRWYGIQASLGLLQTLYTNSNLLKNGYVTQTSISQYNAYDFGGSKFSIGFIPYLNLGFFDKDTPQAKTTQSDYGFGMTPFIEYRVNDWINLHTNSNPLSFEHLRSNSGAHTYNRQTVIQTLAVGFALTRDVYLSPGVEWMVADPRIDRTRTWISATINIF